MTTQTGLDYMRSRTMVDCDTMDQEGLISLLNILVCRSGYLMSYVHNSCKISGPFPGLHIQPDSRQAIAFGELSKPAQATVITTSLSDAEKLHSEYPSISVGELAVEIAMVRLAVTMASQIQGRVHVQTNPYYSYSAEKTVVNALRIVRLFQHIQPGFDGSRIAIKIPSTWEGLMACRTLELAGIRTLATTLFSMPQAVLAAEVGCTYVAPYVNELKVQINTNLVDEQKLLPLCVAIQQFYKSINASTQVLPASLTSIEEIYMLAGVDHLTIAPKLLGQLAEPKSTTVPSLFDTAPTLKAPAPGISFLNDPGNFKMTFSRDMGGQSHRKLTEAINIFCDFQDKLEQMMNRAK
ncbi:hypothetical protein N7462_003777 [Penicillium macrosclerotiorum]|uniref:uncharacterized protein n=1 Tax=Penicillium macrosclerotiorum TaxID=303699 RepID=UPI002548C2B0|nr:uncharacterized protein N7462_003777 [Penicillium macrosclerotiorum]KAJ5689385.1 hypothetical protein N7462_003777 [Penicillium macrosclerotiorum]